MVLCRDPVTSGGLAAVPQLQPPVTLQLQAHSLLQPQSEPQVQVRLGTGLVRPETIGGHEAVCEAPAKPVCSLTSLWMMNVSK